MHAVFHQQNRSIHWGEGDCLSESELLLSEDIKYVLGSVLYSIGNNKLTKYHHDKNSINLSKSLVLSTILKVSNGRHSTDSDLPSLCFKQRI